MCSIKTTSVKICKSPPWKSPTAEVGVYPLYTYYAISVNEGYIKEYLWH